MVKSAVVVFPTECTDCARESSGGADDTGGGTTSDGAEWTEGGRYRLDKISANQGIVTCMFSVVIIGIVSYLSFLNVSNYELYLLNGVFDKMMFHIPYTLELYRL